MSNNLVRIRIAPESWEHRDNTLSGIIITSPATSITRDITTSTTEVFLSPIYANKMAIYCDKKLSIRKR